MRADTIYSALSTPSPSPLPEGEGVSFGFLKIHSQSVVLSLTKDTSLNRVSPL